MDDVRVDLEAMPGVEIHTATPDGKLVVTVEDAPGGDPVVDTLAAIGNVSGVLSTVLVYHYGDETLGEEVNSESH
jgi:nitrate reductase NapD